MCSQKHGQHLWQWWWNPLSFGKADLDQANQSLFLYQNKSLTISLFFLYFFIICMYEYMYVWIYVCMYMYILYMYFHIWIHVRTPSYSHTCIDILFSLNSVYWTCVNCLVLGTSALNQLQEWEISKVLCFCDINM